MGRSLAALQSSLIAGTSFNHTRKGSHRKFAHPRSQRKVILSGASGADAHHYQEKLVKAAIREVQP
jgi:predicted RNA binding protein YcfA (HicA-like mRNA interferase family)